MALSEKLSYPTTKPTPDAVTIDAQIEDSSFVVRIRAPYNVPFRIYFNAQQKRDQFLTDLRNVLTDMTLELSHNIEAHGEVQY